MSATIPIPKTRPEGKLLTMQCSHLFRIALCTFIPLVCCDTWRPLASHAGLGTRGRQHPLCRHVCLEARTLWERGRLWEGSRGVSDRLRIEERRDRVVGAALDRKAWERSGRTAMVVSRGVVWLGLGLVVAWN